MNRRDALMLAGAATFAATGAGCSRLGQRVLPARAKVAPDAAIAVDAETRFLNRAAYGITPGDLARLRDLGREKWLDEQLAAPVETGVPSLVGLSVGRLTGGENGDAENGETPGLLYRLAGIEALHFSTYEQRDFPQKVVLEALTQAALLRAVYSKWQLRERMAQFWSDHFNIYAPKVVDFGKAYATTHLTYYLGADETGVIRAHALGTFPDLLRASAHSPAMLGYLDNQRSSGTTPNENYAREIMELHTLGVGGGYTQKDVLEVARCFSGWGIEDRFYQKRGTFRFVTERHDNGAKTVLGVRIPAGGGESDGDRVLTILANHPSTARFIAGKLVRHFWGHDDAAWTTRLAAIYSRTNGSIPAMLRPLLLSNDLADAPPVLKRPWDFVVSALRATGADTDGGAAVQEHLRNIGQPLHEWPLPNGYPEKTEAWTGSLLARWNFAWALAGGTIERTRLPDTLLKATAPVAAAQAVVGSGISPALRAALASAQSGAEAVALAVCAPGFSWR